VRVHVPARIGPSRYGGAATMPSDGARLSVLIRASSVRRRCPRMGIVGWASSRGWRTPRMFPSRGWRTPRMFPSRGWRTPRPIQGRGAAHTVGKRPRADGWRAPLGATCRPLLWPRRPKEASGLGLLWPLASASLLVAVRGGGAGGAGCLSFFHSMCRPGGPRVKARRPRTGHGRVCTEPVLLLRSILAMAGSDAALKRGAAQVGEVLLGWRQHPRQHTRTHGRLSIDNLRKIKARLSHPPATPVTSSGHACHVLPPPGT
jgi:hypothetical protein